MLWFLPKQVTFAIFDPKWPQSTFDDPTSKVYGQVISWPRQSNVTPLVTTPDSCLTYIDPIWPWTLDIHMIWTKMIAAELQSLTQKQIQSKFSQFNKKEFAKVPAVISLSHLKTTHTATSTYQTNNLTLKWPLLTFDPILTFLAQKFQPVISIAFFILWLKFLSIVKIWISVYIANQWELRSFNQSDQLESFWSGLNQSE